MNERWPTTVTQFRVVEHVFDDTHLHFTAWFRGTLTSVKDDAMELTGQVWFRFGPPSVWLFYRFVRSVAEAHIPVALEWLPYPCEDERLAMDVFLTLDDPTRRGLFLHAMLGLVHIEGMAATEERTVVAALAAAGLDMGLDSLEPTRADDVARVAADLGVAGVPSLYRFGSPMEVLLTQAAVLEDPVPTLRTILETSDNDGIWELRKP